jgi:putative colanic acid biosynthesis UDP-glucose lipid carrier transferase
MHLLFKRFLQLLFLMLDLLFLNVAYLLAQIFFKENPESQHYMRYTQFWMLANGSWVLVAWLGNLYATTSISYFQNFVRNTLRIFGIWALLILLYLFLPRLIELSGLLVFTTIVIYLLGLLINRFLYLGIREWIKRSFENQRRILIVGYNSTARKFTSYLEKEGLGFQIMGYIDDNSNIKELPKYPLYKGIADSLVTAKQLGVKELYSCIRPEHNSKVYQLMKQADKQLVRFRLVADFCQLVDRPIHVEILHDLPLLYVRKEPLQDAANQFIKRSFDIAVSTFVILFILSWMIPLLGLLIKLESKGPILFVQLRSGKDNQAFSCYKFRSMGANITTEAMQATKNDLRVTRIGRILRKTSLDEFPQFLNVLIGNMSVAGPRPHMLKHTEEFSNLADDYMIRHFLKPGITGWAQVNGFRGEIKELSHIKKRVEHDLWYLEHWSLWLDIRIIFLTVYNALKGEENAY